MFITRLISGVVILGLSILMISLGGPAAILFVAAISEIGLFELYRVFSIEKKAPAYVGFISVALLDLAIFLGQGNLILPILVFSFLAMMAIYVIIYPKLNATDIAESFFGIVYVGLMLSYIYQTRMSPDGQFTVWLIYIAAWGCDTMAYCTGKLFGKHKMTQQLSPHKTIEGAVGGVVGAGLIGLIYGTALSGFLTEFSRPGLSCLLIGCLGGLISMLGDLSASAIKRNYNIKDYGKLIPGHGGIMDRFDSIIFTAPIIYYLTVLLQH